MKSTIPTIIRENIIIASLVGIYISIGYLIEHCYVPNIIVLKIINPILFSLAIIFSGCFLLFQILRNRASEYINMQSVVGFVTTVLLLTPFECMFASIKQAIPCINDFCWDYKLMNLDYRLHLNRHPWEILSIFLNNEYILRCIDSMYMLWFIFLIAYCFGMAWSSNRRLRLQFMISSLLVWMIFGSVLGITFSSAGPCYYAKTIDRSHSEDPYQPLLSKLHTYHESKSLWAIRNQIGLWKSKISCKWLPFGGISAMPSVHVAMAMIFLFTSYHTCKFFGMLMAVYAIIILLGSIILAWHYAIDGYISIILSTLLWNLTGKLLDNYPKMWS